MNRKIILFGAFLSTFILILVPNISCVNANILEDKFSNIKNIYFEDLKIIKNLTLNDDCKCIDINQEYLLNNDTIICKILFGLYALFGLPVTFLTILIDYFIFYGPIAEALRIILWVILFPIVELLIFFDCVESFS